ncbi:MAG: amino acid permease [Sandaracinus sp.]
MSLFAKKDLTKVIQEATDPNLAEGGHGLKRSLGALELTTLGIGAIIGAGIFSLTGGAAAELAGPGVVFSFVIGGILCAFAGLCYAELASMIPVAGSAYAYSYSTMGEFIAWIIGWDLALEYAFGAVAVSNSWSAYVFSVFNRSLGIQFPDWVVALTAGPFEEAHAQLADGTTHAVHGIWNVPATCIAILCGLILYRGIRESATFNSAIVILKVVILVVFIALGIGLVSTEHLFVNPNATGLAAMVPAVTTDADGDSHFGWLLGGVLTGAGRVFFAYIGFDAVSTTAQEAKNPKRDLPIGILASLFICTIIYILVAITLTGVVHYTELGVSDPIAVGIDRIVELRGWGATGRSLFTAAIKVGAVAGLSSVILVMMLGQTRVFYAMAHDGLLPWFDKTHPKYQTPHIATVVTLAFVAVLGGCLPMVVVGELVSIGTLLAFVLVCIGVPILRRTDPNQPRPFKVPAPMVVGPLGALACLVVMLGLGWETWLRLIAWMMIGFAVYFFYGRHHSKLQQSLAAKP